METARGWPSAVTFAPLSGQSNVPPPAPPAQGPSGSGRSQQTQDEQSPAWEGVKGFFLGLGQGVVNTVNGVQDAAIGVLNLPATIVNGVALAEEKLGILDPNDPIRVPTIPSPDWSRNLVTYEPGKPGSMSDSHGWSKFLAGNGVVILATAGAGEAGEASTTAEKAVVETEEAVAEEAGEAGATQAAEGKLNCFPAGTLVATPRGLFPIESLNVGDEVWAYDLVHSRWRPRKIIKTYITDHEGLTATITVADEEIEATYLHPFWVVRGEGLADRPVRGHLPHAPEASTTTGRWVDAGDVRVGDELLLRDGRILPVQAVRCQPYNDKVYNYHIADFECYAVGRNCVLVHNTNGNPIRVTNIKHHPNSASPEPTNVQELFDRSVVDNKGVRWAQDADGVIHRFSKPSNGESHWNGSTGGTDPIRLEDIPIAIRRILG